MNQRKLRVSAMVLCTVLALPGWVQEAGVSGYARSKAELPYRDQFEAASGVIASSTDDAARNAALGDIEKMSPRLERQEEAVELLETFLQRPDVTSDSTLYQHAFLVRARILYRTGQRDAAGELFRQAAVQDFQDAYIYYIDTLEEGGETIQAAREQFNFAVDERVLSESWRNFIAHFFIKLVKMKQAQPDVPAMEEVFPVLKSDEKRPEFTEVARALCLIADGAYEEAVAALQALEESFAKSRDLPKYGEHRNLPLYLAAAYVVQGKDRPQTQAHLREFLARNPDRPEYALRMSTSLCEALEFLPGGFTKIEWLTEVLLAEGYGEEDKYNGELTDDYWIAHLIDFQGVTLGDQGRWQEAKAVYQRVADEYFPRNPAGVHAMLELGYITWREDKDFDTAQDCFRRIITESNDHSYIRYAKRGLIDVWREQQTPEAEMAVFLDDLHDSAAPDKKAEVQGLRDTMVRQGFLDRTTPSPRQ